MGTVKSANTARALLILGSIGLLTFPGGRANFGQRRSRSTLGRIYRDIPIHALDTAPSVGRDQWIDPPRSLEEASPANPFSTRGFARNFPWFGVAPAHPSDTLTGQVDLANARSRSPTRVRTFWLV